MERIQRKYSVQILRAALLVGCLALLPGLALAAPDFDSMLTADVVPGQTATAGWPRHTKQSESGMHFGVGIKMSSLGAGVEGAVGFNAHSGARIGGNFFQYNHTFISSGISYPTALSLRSAQVTYDWFPFGGSFHISPGVLYSANSGTATPYVASGTLFTLQDTSYRSGAVPVSGWAKAKLNPVDPVLLIGWGNLAHRTKHIIFSVEGGVAYHGAPKITLGLAGTVCDPSQGPSGSTCRPIASDATVQANVLALQAKLQHNASPFVVYPVIVLGVGYRF